MRFQLTDDQRALRDGMRSLLRGRFGRERLRACVEKPGLDRALWASLAEAGLFTLRLPEDAGGAGLGLPEAVLLFAEAGRALVPGPLVATHLAGRGDAVVTVGEPAGSVPYLEDADLVLTADGPRPAASVRGQAEPVRSVDPLTPLHRTSAGSPEALRYEGALLTAALQLGGAEAVLKATVAHVRARAQFGRPVGAFQAVKHLCADMLTRVELARVAVYAAAVTGDAADVATAKLLADEAAVRGARDAIQLHGGLGFTWEADLHLYLKRAWLHEREWLSGAGAADELALLL
ncbi:acyl-CoA dehydrogenase [Streptomyces sp. NPDC051940]|uniref:acyl-CoA dehydrogenase n=1 Tax=Streptomyces sp. NPDC051940 TaxID=3155675 RepID=UPI003433C140